MSETRALHPLEEEMFQAIEGNALNSFGVYLPINGLFGAAATDAEKARKLKEVLSKIKKVAEDKNQESAPQGMSQPELPDINTKMKGDTALIAAIRKNSPQCVQALVDAKADVNARVSQINRVTPLIMMATNSINSPAIVTSLLKAGADVSLVDGFHNTAATYFATRSDESTLNAFLDHSKINVNTLFDFGLHMKMSMLMVAALGGTEHTVRVLMDRSADQTLVSFGYKYRAIDCAWFSKHFHIILLLSPQPEFSLTVMVASPKLQQEFKNFLLSQKPEPVVNFYLGIIAESEKLGSGCEYLKKSKQHGWAFPYHAYRYLVNGYREQSNYHELMLCYVQALDANVEVSQKTEYFYGLVNLAEQKNAIEQRQQQASATKYPTAPTSQSAIASVTSTLVSMFWTEDKTKSVPKDVTESEILNLCYSYLEKDGNFYTELNGNQALYLSKRIYKCDYFNSKSEAALKTALFCAKLAFTKNPGLIEAQQRLADLQALQQTVQHDDAPSSPRRPG